MLGCSDEMPEVLLLSEGVQHGQLCCWSSSQESSDCLEETRPITAGHISAARRQCHRFLFTERSIVMIVLWTVLSALGRYGAQFEFRVSGSELAGGLRKTMDYIVICRQPLVIFFKSHLAAAISNLLCSELMMSIKIIFFISIAGLR